jgi:hypothetical protein
LSKLLIFVFIFWSHRRWVHLEVDYKYE